MDSYICNCFIPLMQAHDFSVTIPNALRGVKRQELPGAICCAGSALRWFTDLDRCLRVKDPSSCGR